MLAYLLLQTQTMAVGTKFIFYMVELPRFLWSFYNSESQGGGEPNLECTERPVIYSTLAKNLRRWLSRIQFIFVTDRSFTADGGPL